MAVAGKALMMTFDRSNVLVLGAIPIDTAPFTERRLTCVNAVNAGLTDAMLSTALGVVISDNPGQYRLVSEFFASNFRRASALGLRVAIQIQNSPHSSTDRDITQISRFRDTVFRDLGVVIDDFARSCVKVGHPIEEIAEDFARHNPGPPIGTPDLIYLDLNPKKRLSDETELCLKRAFFDCSSIAIEQLTGGKTAKATLRIHATPKDAQYGKQAMPFFFKHGWRHKIEEEKRNYRDWAEPFIPFHLRPALNEFRSVLTLTEGAIVGNFVEGGISLREALRSGQGNVGIYSLFEVTLRGLRAAALASTFEIGPVRRFIEKKVRSKEIDEKYPGRIRRARELGFTADVLEMEKFLLERASTIATRHGMSHGDSHAGNVIMRQRDAVVIDFGSMLDLPITVDPAILEVSLVFGTDKGDDPLLNDDWLKLITDTFIDLSPDKIPQTTEEHARFTWLLKAVRELRHIFVCDSADPNERLIVLAAALLRFNRLTKSDLEGVLFEISEERRAYALVVAQKICERL